MQYFEQQDALAGKIKIVVNRLGLEDSQISLNKALETIGRDVYWQVPNDYATMVESRNNGVPLLTQAPRAKLTKSIQQLSQSLNAAARSAEEETDERPQRKGLFSFLGSGTK
jgi:pilus assembly protein CpaE